MSPLSGGAQSTCAIRSLARPRRKELRVGSTRSRASWRRKRTSLRRWLEPSPKGGPRRCDRGGRGPLGQHTAPPSAYQIGNDVIVYRSLAGMDRGGNLVIFE